MTKHFSPLVGKPSTGEPDAGEPHVRFGGRGGATQCVVPTPIENFVMTIGNSFLRTTITLGQENKNKTVS